MAPRTYCKDFTLRLGPATTTGLLVPIRSTVSRGNEPKLVTPDLRPVRQVYIDENGQVYEKEDLGRAIEVEDENGERKLQPVDADALKEAKISKLPINILNLTVHDAAEVNEYMFPDKNQGYVFQPVKKDSKGKVINDPANVQWHDFINIVLRDANVALVGKCNLQNHEGFFRLGLFQGHIYLQKQLYPEDLNRFEFSTPILSDDVQAEARKVARKLVRDFEPTAYENEIAQRLEMIKTGNFGEVTQPVVESTPDGGFDLLSALKGFE